ncbi:MAG: hypothetical protein LBS27_04990 [Bifidobacteriaceae bacterium]|jgi:hypothetical protein|nr:hypothetical protein [Bifidobacteriaceae bacterium]
MRRFALALLAGLIVAGLGGAPAWAASYLDDAVQGLTGARGWVSSEVTSQLDLAKVLSADIDGQVAVAVLPDTAKLESSPSATAADLRARTDWPTVLVAMGEDFSADSAELTKTAALTAANQAERAPGALEDKLVAAVASLAEALDQARNQAEEAGAAPTASSSAADGDMAGAGRTVLKVLAWTFFFVVVVPAALITALVVWLVKRHRRGGGRAPIKPSKQTPPDVAEKLEELRALRVRYLNARVPGPAFAATKNMAQMIARIVTDTSELFRRLESRGGGDQQAVARVEYRDQVAKVVEVLGPDYYLDILARPDLWDDPRGRARAVEAAVAAFSSQIIDNIKQVNAAQDLRFQVSLDALARAKRDQAAGLYDPTDPPNERPRP